MLVESTQASSKGLGCDWGSPQVCDVHRNCNAFFTFRLKNCVDAAVAHLVAHLVVHGYPPELITVSAADDISPRRPDCLQSLALIQKPVHSGDRGTPLKGRLRGYRRVECGLSCRRALFVKYLLDLPDGSILYGPIGERSALLIQLSKRRSLYRHHEENYTKEEHYTRTRLIG